MAQINCRNFSGYKPCPLGKSCTSECSAYDPVEQTIAIVHLGALGAVVRSTSLLKAIKLKHPRAKIIWITDKPGHHLLANHPLIDRVLTSEFSDLLVAQSFNLSEAYVIDKSLKAIGIANFLNIKKIHGFNSLNGSIVPATPRANELWQLGLSNQKKFFENKKSEVQLMCEALELDVDSIPDYNLPLNAHEQYQAHERSKAWKAEKKFVLGINTGCSEVIPAKKLTVAQHRDLIQKIQNAFSEDFQIVLLGGPEDTQRNEDIAQGFDLILSSTTSGLRDGLVSVAACDVVLSGDSLGMHMALSQGCYVIAWFGPTCAHEIEFYGRGEAIQAQVSCAPCWKRSCQKEVMCYDRVSSESWLQALQRGLEFVSKSRCSNRIFGGSSPFSTAPEENQIPLAK